MMNHAFAKRKYFLLYTLTCMLAIACTKVQTTEELQTYIKDPDNGLHKEREIGRVKMSVTYRPTDLLVKQSLSSSPTDGEIDSLRRDFGKMAYFVLSMSADDKEVETFALQNAGFGERVQTLAFGMGEYVRIITDARDTIPVADYFYQRTYGVGKTSDLLMAFDAEKLKQVEELKFQISEFGLGVGDQNLQFQTDDILDAPLLDKTAMARL
jgi:hypothetical protein